MDEREVRERWREMEEEEEEEEKGGRRGNEGAFMPWTRAAAAAGKNRQ